MKLLREAFGLCDLRMVQSTPCWQSSRSLQIQAPGSIVPVKDHHRGAIHALHSSH